MFDITIRNCIDLDADKSIVPLHQYESGFLLPQLMMIHAMPSGVSWHKTTCRQLTQTAGTSHMFSRLMHALKRRITS